MSGALWRDENAQSIADAMGLHEIYATTGIISATTGAATAEVSLSTITVAAPKVGGGQMVCITNGSANDAMYAFGAAGAAAGFTDLTTMVLIPKQWVKYLRIDPSVDKSFYHKQITGANSIQLVFLK
jgi:hypothetical protein